MVCTGFYRRLTQPVVALTLFASTVMTCPSPSMAQLPVLQNGRPARPTRISPGQPQTPYTLGAGDRIRIDIFEVPQYSGEYQVLADGSIQLPLIGRLPVEGLTLTQASNVVTAAYNQFLKRPIITLSLLSPRPLNVTVSGEVNRPGSYTVTLTGGIGDVPGLQYPTISQALQLAEGITLLADVRQIQVSRRSRRGIEQVFTIDFWDLIQRGDVTQDLTLRDGDTIYVPLVDQVNLAEIRQIAASRIGPPLDKSRSVGVVGEVLRPGSYVVLAGNIKTEQTTTGLPTVSRALELAGGVNSEADLRRILIRRTTKAGGEKLIDVNLWQLLQAGDSTQNTVLQDGDTILVPTATDVNPAEVTELAVASFSPETIQVSVVGEVKLPGVVKVAPNTTLNQAILTAGGFNDARANRDAVDLIRLNPDGTVTKSLVKINLTAGINEQTNPLLRNNDIIVVSRNGAAKTGDSISAFLGPVDRVSGVFSILNILRIFGR